MSRLLPAALHGFLRAAGCWYDAVLQLLATGQPASHAAMPAALQLLHLPSHPATPARRPAADHTVKVWDVTTQQCQHTLQHHSDKVQAVAWNPAEPPVLLSGGFDKRACLVSKQ